MLTLLLFPVYNCNSLGSSPLHAVKPLLLVGVEGLQRAFHVEVHNEYISISWPMIVCLVQTTMISCLLKACGRGYIASVFVYHISVGVLLYLKAQRLSWFSHLHRMPEERMVKKVYKWKPMLRRPLGRPKNRWEDDIRNDMKKLKMKNWTNCIQDRNNWQFFVEKAKTFKDWSCSAWRRRSIKYCDPVFGLYPLSGGKQTIAGLGTWTLNILGVQQRIMCCPSPFVHQ